MRDTQWLAELSWGDAQARAGLGLAQHHSDPGSGGTRIWREHRQVPFMRNVEAIHQDWSGRWGTRVSGWWIDGCYEAECRFPEDDPPNFRTLADALRSGNPDALVAFNPGVLVPVISHTEHEDYTAGEIAGALPECPGPWVERNGHRARYHVLTYMGAYWCRGEPRFPDDLVMGYTQHVTSKGGVITWDVPISTGGLIPEPFVRQLACVGERLPRSGSE